MLGEIQIAFPLSRRKLSPPIFALSFPPNTPYFYTDVDMQENIRYRFLHFTGSGVENLLRDINLEMNRPVRVDVNEEVEGLWEELFFAFRNYGARIDTLSSVIFPYILIKVAQSQSEKPEGFKKLDLSIKYIHTHLSRHFSVEELASMEYLSPGRYREIFKEITGHSPLEYITELKLRWACELFAEGNKSIEETALAVGYGDRLYFQRIFKKYIGMTPGQYINSLKNIPPR